MLHPCPIPRGAQACACASALLFWRRKLVQLHQVFGPLRRGRWPWQFGACGFRWAQKDPWGLRFVAKSDLSISHKRWAPRLELVPEACSAGVAADGRAATLRAIPPSHLRARWAWITLAAYFGLASSPSGGHQSMRVTKMSNTNGSSHTDPVTDICILGRKPPLLNRGTGWVEEMWDARHHALSRAVLNLSHNGRWLMLMLLWYNHER
jgi:hypothetical protein